MRTDRILVALLTSLTFVGCQPAGRYPPRGTRSDGPVETPRPVTSPENSPPPPRFAPVDYPWEEADLTEMEPPVPIRFVVESSDRDEWNRLTEYWTVVDLPKPGIDPKEAAQLLGVPSRNVVPLAAQVNRIVKVKVPLGLGDPRGPAVSREANPATLGKWEIGKELFFNKEIFLQPGTASAKTSCASCHEPGKGFADNRVPTGVGAFLTPRLLNTAYPATHFWDGRTRTLEETIQYSLPGEAEVAKGGADQPHRWVGAVARLREDVHFVNRFHKVFGTLPTQDAVAKSLATYLRTLLSGNSIQDQAERELRLRGGKALEAQDYEKVLTDDTLKKLKPEEGMNKEAVAKQLLEGSALFHGKANCAACHGGRTYSDNSFHNLGIRESGEPVLLAGREPGRFATLPLGLKERRMVGAFRTPSLRSLPAQGPFFHDGLRPAHRDDKNAGPLDGLFDVTRYHIKDFKPNEYLDPLIEKIDLSESEVRAVALFLRALDGEALPKEVTDAAPMVETLPAPKPK